MGTTGLSLTLANSIIGVGILAMPFCFQQCGVLLAALILLLMGLVSRLCCYFLLKSALLARRRNFEFLAFHVFGPAGKMAVEVGIIGFLMGTCIAYFVVVGDLGPQIIANMFNINQSDILRTSIMVIVSLVCVLPLGLLRNVDSLSNVSAATIGFYFCLVMKVIAEAASQLWSAEWQRRVQLWRPAGVLQCVPILSMALFCQTQLFEIFESLPILSLEKMNIVTKNAINICSGVYLTLGVFGYIAFSSHEISGNILMSLSPTMASDVIKLGFVMSLAFSFPLIIFPCRASLYSFLYKKVHSSHHDHIINHSIPETTFRCITVAIVAVALFISLLIPNIELVLGLVGSTIGVLICVVFPAACFVNVTFKNTNERVLAKAVVVLGLIIMVLGTYANLQAAENIDRYDDKYITQERIDKMVEDFFEKRQNNDQLIAKPISNGNEVLNEIIKDSEVQPPNPVPPESQSVEKIAPNVIPVIKESNKLKAVPEPTNNIDKVSEAHPKNVMNKLNGARTNGENNKNTDVNHDNDAPVINNIEKPKEESKPTSNEDKIQINKQKQLIETIKQHGEEQKELIQEQKEILDEIIKTKQELQQNKNEDSVQAKKIAVESIKQIANMAIQSIGGVTDKPVGEEVKKSDRLEKLTNDAVKEIAKKAVETIEAIHDIKDKPLLPESKDDKPVNVANGLNLESNVMNKVAPVENSIQNEVVNGIDNSQKQTQNIVAQEPIKNEPAMNPPVDTNTKLIVNEDNIAKSNAKVIKNEPAVNLPVDTNVKSIVNDDRIAKANVPANSPVQEEKPRETKLDSKNHSHSPDEPQSYKQGEDAQKNAGVIQNVPLPLMNLQAKDKEPIVLSNDNNVNSNVQMNAANLKNGDTLPRQKREVVDCSETTLIKPEDIQICEKLKDTKDIGLNEILKPVDLNDVNLKRLRSLGENLKAWSSVFCKWSKYKLRWTLCSPGLINLNRSLLHVISGHE